MKQAESIQVGIIGGMGSQAGEAYQQALTRADKSFGAKNDQQYTSFVFKNAPEIPDRTAYLLKGGVDPRPALYDHVESFRSADVSLAVGICNTFHADAILGINKAVNSEEIGLLSQNVRLPLERKLRAGYSLQELAPDIPFISMIKATKVFAEKNFPGKKVGLMATDGTVQTGIYHAEIPEIIAPDPEFQQKLMFAIYAIKADFSDEASVKTDTQKEQLLKVLQEHPSTKDAAASLTVADIKSPKEWLLEVADHLKGKGVEVAIMGCTEIPLVLMPELTELPVIDTIKVLAMATSYAARDAGLAEYINEHKGKETWRLGEVQKRLGTIMEVALDLEKHPQFKAFFGEPKKPEVECELLSQSLKTELRATNAVPSWVGKTPSRSNSVPSMLPLCYGNNDNQGNASSFVSIVVANRSKAREQEALKIEQRILHLNEIKLMLKDMMGEMFALSPEDPRITAAASRLYALTVVPFNSDNKVSPRKADYRNDVINQRTAASAEAVRSMV